MEKFKSGFVTIIGRPNVGKSTLLNHIMGEKLSIISSKPQTTRNNIEAIHTMENCQMIFIDTPGLHRPKHKLGEFMVKSAEETLKDVDLILFLIEPDIKLNASDKHIIEMLDGLKVPVILVINKIDTVKKDILAKTIELYSNEHSFSEIVPVSALTGDNIDELLNVVSTNLPVGPKYFPDDMICDQPEKFIVSEMIREKMLHFLDAEVPHGTAVEVEIMTHDDEKNITTINANIYCEKETHKAIIIGKGGLMLKKIGQAARIDIERFLGSKVYLELWVKVKKDWRDNPSTLKSFGYK